MLTLKGDAFGLPLAGATIQMAVLDAEGEEARRAETRTDERGNATLELLHSEGQTVVARARHHLACEESWRWPVPSGDVSKVLELRRRFPIEGRIEAAPEGARVRISMPFESPQPLMELARATAEEDGTFRVEVGEWHPGILWAVACAPGHLPTETEFSLERAEITDLGTIGMAAGASIRGRVISSLPPEYRSDLLGVGSDVRGTQFDWEGIGTYNWTEDGPTLRVGWYPIATDGTFEVSGLRPGVYSLGIKQSVTLRDANPRVDVTAPSDGVLLTEDSPLVVLTARDVETGARISRVRFHWSHLQLPCWIRRPMAVGAMQRYSGELRHPDYRPVRIEIPPLGPGTVFEEVVGLVPVSDDRPETELALHVTDVYGEPVRSLRIRVGEEGEEREFSLLDRFSRSPSGVHSLPLRTGEYRLTVEPNTQDVAFRSPLTATSFTYRCTGLDSDRMSVVLEVGGRIVMDVRGRGAAVRASIDLASDEDDEELESVWIPYERQNLAMYFGWIPGSGPMQTRDPLPPGDYRVSVSSDGFEPVSRVVTVTAATDELVRLDLEPVD